MTWIQGTGVPEDDASGNRGTGSIDLQVGSHDDSEVAAGDYSAILGGTTNTIIAGCDGGVILGGQSNTVGDGGTGGDYSVAFGSGAIAHNDNMMAFGQSMYVNGDAQCEWYTRSGDMSGIDNNWNTFASFDIPTDTTWTFLALIVGIAEGAAESFSYKIEGCIENDGGTVTLLAQTVTTIYEDDASYNVQAIANDGANELEIQVTDSDNSGNDTYWHVNLQASSVTWAAA